MPVMAVGATPEGRTLMVGLSRKDILKLLHDEPIMGSLEKAVGIPGLKLLVFFGETDESIRAIINVSVPTKVLDKNATADDLSKLLDEDREKNKH